MADGKQIALFGMLGVGGYIVYEYYRYSSAINTLVGGDQTQIASAEAALPFFTFLSMNWGGAGTSNQVQIYNALQAILSGTTTASSPQPGTTSTSQPTSISNAPSTTPAPLPPAPPANSPSQLTSYRSTGIASQMEQLINMSSANADQWNWAYAQLTGQGIDAQYGFNFDTVYGPVVNGVRNNGATMSAPVFLQKAGVSSGALAGGASRTTTKTLHGLGVIANFVGPRYSTVGNMVYQIHHPFPYLPTYTLKGLTGLGTVTQAMGFEKALLAGQPLRSNRIR